MKKSFEMWMGTLKKHVQMIERHEAQPREVTKYVFQEMLAHLVLGWQILEENRSKIITKHVVSSLYGKLGDDAQERANREAAERAAEAAKVLLWWKAKDRFRKFAIYVAMLLEMSPQAPHETIFDRLVEALKAEKGWAKKAWKKGASSTSKSKDINRHEFGFAESVARLIVSDLKNVDVRDDLVPEIWSRNNLSILLGQVEKSLRDQGFTPGSLYSDVSKSLKNFDAGVTTSKIVRGSGSKKPTSKK